MLKKIISALLAVTVVFGFAACAKKIELVETTTEEVMTTGVPETQATTVTTTAAPTTATTTTAKPTTAKPSTTKKVTTTVKAVITTIVETTQERPSRPDPLDRNYRTEDKTENVALKYGVYRSSVTTTTYVKLEDGSEEVYDVEVTEVYSRIGYSASYEELLPAAEENKQKYASEINEILRIINSYREDGGLEPLILDGKLTTIACARAEEIAWSGRHSHYRPNNKFFSSILNDAGIAKGSAGENIGWGYSDVSAVCEAWKNSETHYANIMNPEFTRIGIGVAADPDPEKNLCWSQLFIDRME